MTENQIISTAAVHVMPTTVTVITQIIAQCACSDVFPPIETPVPNLSVVQKGKIERRYG